MKKAIVLFTALFYCSLCLGQNNPDKAKLSWSKEFRGKKKMTFSQVIGGDESGVYITKTTIKDNVRGNNSLPIMERYDKNLGLIKSEKLKVKKKEGRLTYVNIIQMDGNLYLFYSLVNIWKKSLMLMLQPLDKENLLVVGKAKKIMETKIPAISQRDQLMNFELKLSEDKTSLMIFHTTPSVGSKPEKIQLIVLDKHMNLDWSKEVILSYKDKLFETVNFYLDNERNVYLLGKNHHTKRTDKKSGKPNYNFLLLSYLNNGTDFRTHDISNNDKLFMDMKIAVNHNSDIICSGFYSNEGTGSIGGSYYLKLESGTHKIKKESYNDFSSDFLTQNMPDKKLKKTIKIEKGKEPEMYSYKLDNMVIREDGSITLVGEQMKEINIRRNSQFTQPVPISPMAQSNRNRRLSTTSDHYSYHDIIVIHFSPEGEIEWSEKIVKKQDTSSDFGFFSSYTMASVKDKVYFIFNDNPQNLHNNCTETLKNFNPTSKDYMVVLVTLDSQGNQSKEVLSIPRDTNILIKPSVSKQISLNQLIFYGQFRENFRLAKLEFEGAFSY
ncbi:MAG: hypothetical protein WD426_15510 [Anditalea sp.]